MKNYNKSKVQKLKDRKRREELKEEGFYDGRFKPKVFKDKKKEKYKKKCREDYEEDEYDGDWG